MSSTVWKCVLTYLMLLTIPGAWRLSLFLSTEGETEAQRDWGLWGCWSAIGEIKSRTRKQFRSHTLSLTLHWLFCCIWVMVQSFEALQTDGSCSWTYTGTIPGNVYWVLTKHACETLTCHADPLRGQRLAALTNAVPQESPPPLSAVPWKQPACPSPSVGVDYRGKPDEHFGC